MASIFDKPPTPVNICENDPVNGVQPALATLANGTSKGSDSVGGGHSFLDSLSTGLHGTAVHKQIVAK